MAAHDNSFPQYVYRLLLAPEWATFQTKGYYDGSAIDTKDGYLHMSTADTVVESANKYFAGKTDLQLIKIDLNHAAIKDHIRWDAVESRGGALFPHLYDVKLPIAAVTQHLDIPWDVDAKHFNFPAELTA